MKAKQLIKLLKQHPEAEVIFSLWKHDGRHLYIFREGSEMGLFQDLNGVEHFIINSVDDCIAHQVYQLISKERIITNTKIA